MAKRATKTKFIEHESTIGGVISDAMSELQMLGEEMREAYDNTPENFQSIGVGEARGEAADSLENLTEPSVPEKFENIVVKYQSVPPKRRQSRSDRRHDAVHGLNAVVETLDEFIDDDKANSQDDRNEAGQLRDEVQNLIDEAEAVEFPGMYG